MEIGNPLNNSIFLKLQLISPEEFVPILKVTLTSYNSIGNNYVQNIKHNSFMVQKSVRIPKSTWKNLLYMYLHP